jgi:hypothetical protein
MKTWSHPELGKFVLTDTGWSGICSMPSFKAFRFSRPGKSRLKIEFETEIDSENLPKSREIAIAKRVIKNEASLAKRLIRALFDDLNGKGLDSGMWWHGDTQSILEFMDENMRSKIDLTAEDDVPKLIGSPSVWIRPKVDYYKKPCAVILFEAAFDPEHGLGVLTDGSKVIGTGYQMSVSPFFKYQYRG